MKNTLKILLPMLALTLSLLLSVEDVKAASIETLSATARNGTINVSGTAESGMLAAAIMIYDETGTSLIQMETVSVGDDHRYSNTFSVNPGTYKVKVADYEGGAFKETEVTVGSSVTPIIPPTNPTEDYTVPVEGDNTVQIEASISNGIATVAEITQDNINKVINEGAAGSSLGTGTITIDFSDANSDVTGVVLTKSTVGLLAKTANDSTNNIKTVEIKLSDAVVTINATALTSIATKAKGNDIELAVENTSNSGLNVSQRTQISSLNTGSKSVAMTFEAYIVSGGVRMSSFNGGFITIGKIDFKIPTGKSPKNYHIYYIPESGVAVKYDTWYENGMLYFTTNHLSDYAIVHDENEENGKPATLVNITRMYNPATGDHFYTASASEAASAKDVCGYINEGSTYFKVDGAGSEVYRAYCPASGDHFYTTYKPEWEASNACGYVLEGIAFISSKSGRPVYRMYNPKNGDHFYTVDKVEAESAKSVGYVEEGIAFYVD